MENTALEIRASDSNRKFKWMLLLSKEPELAGLMMEISNMDEEDKKFIQRTLRSTIDSIQLYSIAKERAIRKEEEEKSSSTNFSTFPLGETFSI